MWLFMKDFPKYLSYSCAGMIWVQHLYHSVLQLCLGIGQEKGEAGRGHISYQLTGIGLLVNSLIPV